LNLSAQLKESVDQILEIIEIPDIQDNPDIELGPDSDDQEEVGDTIVVRAHTPEPRGESEQPIEENQQRNHDDRLMVLDVAHMRSFHTNVISAERSSATLIRRARAIRIDARLPENLWPEAFKAGF
jgi:hypothetical protein